MDLDNWQVAKDEILRSSDSEIYAANGRKRTSKIRDTQENGAKKSCNKQCCQNMYFK